MRLAVIVPAYNRCEVTLACLKQLAIYLSGFDYTFVVVDDGSTDETASIISEYSSDTIILKGNGSLWWTGAVEKGRIYAIEHNFSHLMLVNDDLEFDPSFFLPLIRASEKHADALIGAVKVDLFDRETVLATGYIVKGACLHYQDKYAGSNLNKIKADLIKFDALAGATLLIPIDVAKKVGSFNCRDFPHNFGDLEYTYRASLQGYPCYTATRSIIYTEPNPNYLRTALYTTTRKQFITNLFDKYKFAYGFIPILKRAYMNKSWLIGTFCLARAYTSLTRKILYKLFIWETIFDVNRKKRQNSSN